MRPHHYFVFFAVFSGNSRPLSQGDCRVIALSETTRDQVVQSINLFLASMIYRVLIVSYEVGQQTIRCVMPTTRVRTTVWHHSE